MKKISETINKQRSRTTNTILNFTFGIGGQLLNLLLQFIVRTVFVHTLGKAYLGIGGVFSNFLSMLSLAELGVGSAILFKLYEPIARKDRPRIVTLMCFYRNAYRWIGLVIATIGILAIPFLPYIIKDYDRLADLNINAVLIFFLFLSRTVSSYFFFAYKSAIIKATQKEYLINIIKYFGSILSSVVQIILLWVYPNFVLYVLITTFTVIFENILTALLADRLYPYIKDKPREKIAKTEVKEMFKDCSALFLYKLNGVVLKATDNLVLSGFVGMDIVALYSNYYIIYTAIKNISNRLFGSVTHSLGNLHTEKKVEHEYVVFKTINLISAIFGGTVCVGIMCVIDEFICMWIGKEWAIDYPFAILMGIEAYSLPIKAMQARLRSSMGLFQQAKFRPLASMIINLILSILLVQVWGISGVIFATIVSDWTTLMWYDPIIINKYGYHNIRPVSHYFCRLIKYTLTTLVVCLLDLMVCKHVLVGFGWLSIVFHILICLITTPIAMLIVSWKSEEAIYVRNMMNVFITRIIRKIGHKKHEGK